MSETEIIDCHMHIFPTREEGRQDKTNYQIWEYGQKPDVHFSSYDGDLEDALRAIAESRVSRAVVVNLFLRKAARANAIAALPGGLGGTEREKAIAEIDAGMGDRLREFNLWICGVAREHPQLIPFVSVDPWLMTPQESADHLRELVLGHGARGIKIHPIVQEFHVMDDRMRPVYETCLELGIPVLSHSGPARGPDQFAEPRAFAGLLREYPRLTVVLAHLGGAAWRQTLEVARSYPNASFDCCEVIEWTGGSAAATDEELAQLIKGIGPERVMMGTDFPWYDLDHTARRVMDLPLLASEEKEGILGANAVRILGL